MLLAVAHDDRTSFDRLWQWTQNHLQVRDDRLLAWRWTSQNGVSDKNNATDGDLYVAWALLRASRHWQQPQFKDAAIGILTDVRQKLIHHDPRGPTLLPGMEGFAKPEGITVNLSYWLFPAFAEFDRDLPDPVWQGLTRSGIQLLMESRFGRWSLPPDWLALNGKLAPAAGFVPRFGYDAVRIPLYLLWAKLETPELLRPCQDFWRHFDGARFQPAWTRLDDDSIDSWDAAPGIRAIVSLTQAAPKLDQVRLPALDAKQDYYSASLLLLAKTMQAER